MAKRATLKELAALTGLSMMTISKYVNNIPIKKKNARIIEQAIKQLNYSPNLAAKNLRTNQSMAIGVLITRLNDPFSTSIVMGAEQVFYEKGYGFIVCDCYNGDSRIVEERLRFLISKQVDGLLSIAPDDAGPILSVAQNDVPIVQVDYPMDGFTGDVVMCDNREASHRIVALALEKGHTRIGIIAGSRTSHTSRECVAGYRDALSSHGIAWDESLVQYGEYRKSGGAAATAQLLDMNDRPSAIYVINNSMAIGLIRLLHERSIVIGRDIGIIGRDLQNLLEVVTPEITSVEQPLEALGAETAKLLLRRMKGDMESYPTHKMLKCSLVMGDSIERFVQP